MSSRFETLRLGLSALPEPDAQRVLLFRLLLASSLELRTRMDRLLADSGLTTQQAMLLHFLTAEPAPPTLTQFAHQLAMSHQNLKQIATALERKGLVEIVVDERDRRVRRLRLTGAHEALWQQRDPSDFEHVASWTDSLNDDEVRSTVAALDTLHHALIRSRSAFE
ncbi:MAG: MarR family transcriptional regulator [Gemmatimonadaceae bacterium]|nr:MarR family transcriptional regulator [Gemmatimonadaceae bacterium]